MLTRALIELWAPFPALGLGIVIRAWAAPPPATKWEALCFAPFFISCIVAQLARMAFWEHARENPLLTDEEREEWVKRLRRGAGVFRYWSLYRHVSTEASPSAGDEPNSPRAGA